MKKLITLLLVAVMCSALVACGGKDFTSRNFDEIDLIDTFVIDGFSWDMTIDDVKEYFGEENVEIGHLEDDEVVLSSGSYSFIFSTKNGNLLCMDKTIGSNMHTDIEMHLGKCDKEFAGYWWYGTLAGVKTEMYLDTTTDPDSHDVIFFPVD